MLRVYKTDKSHNILLHPIVSIKIIKITSKHVIISLLKK